MNLTVPDRPFAVRPTTWIEPERLRAALGLRITLVSETFQRTGSFKFRAAFHRGPDVVGPAPDRRFLRQLRPGAGARLPPAAQTGHDRDAVHLRPGEDRGPCAGTAPRWS